MLADVWKQREEEQRRLRQDLESKYNHPYKRDTIIYFDHIYRVGGIQTWIVNLAKKYEFSVVYDRADEERASYLESLGIELIRYIGQPIECNTLIRCIWGNADIKAKETILAVHGNYSKLLFKKQEVPKHDRVICVSKDSAKGWKEFYGEDAEVIYNPVEIFEDTKPLIIGMFSRLSAEKGRWRYELLIKKLKESGKPFLILMFTDRPLEEETDKRIIQFEPIMNPIGWMSKCDYIALLSDTEACPYNVLEAMKMGKPMIITKLDVLNELGVNKTNSKILEMDMSNLDIEDLWNIPVVKNWKEPNSKGWEAIMKKKVFREKNATPVVEESTEPVIEPVEEVKPKTAKKAKKNE